MSRKFPYRYAYPIVIACALVIASFAVPRGDLAAQDNPPESEVCLGCHDGKDATLAPTAHALSTGAPKEGVTPIACIDCHTGDRRHWEEDPASFAMTNPSKLDPGSQAELCSSCHETSHQQNMREKNAHARNDVNCSGCHSVHQSKHEPLLKKAESGLCLGCHTDVEGQFAMPFRHPVNDDIVKCSECHLTLDETRRELSRNGTNVCMKCHAEFQGPFPFEHQANLDFSTEEGGCLTCHEAHGSTQPRMLKQPYEAPHFQLCTQCHLVPRHNFNEKHGTDWAGLACNTCHTDIHGSYSSPHFLRESLEAEGCFKAGCHR